MSVATVKLSSKGQIVIPKEIRDELHWEPGTQLALVSSASGVTLQALPRKTGRNLGDLIGMLQHHGPPAALEDLCKPGDTPYFSRGVPYGEFGGSRLSQPYYSPQTHLYRWTLV